MGIIGGGPAASCLQRISGRSWLAGAGRTIKSAAGTIFGKGRPAGIEQKCSLELVRSQAKVDCHTVHGRGRAAEDGDL